jgi:predicted PurR-regulated permease PerM
MAKRNKWIIMIPAFLLGAYLIWFFSNIVLYILISAVLSIMGHPLVVLLDKIKIGKFKMPHTLSAILTLLAIYGFIIGFFAIVVPILVSQIQSISAIDTTALMNGIKEPLEWLNNFMINHQMISSGESIELLITNKVTAYANFTNASDIANTLIDLAGSLFIAIFAVAFITFFFLKQNRMLLNGIMVLTPVRHQSEIKHVYLKIVKLLSKYFLGLCLDLFIVITLITITTWLFGFKNALMIGFFAGIMNIIPYIGPFIGWGLAMLFAITGIIDNGQTLDLFSVFLKISGTLVAINMLDAFIMQPTIYANVVKAHPLEIFLVILLAGSLAGIPGMILAIPSYTVLRIIAKEFLHKYPVVKQITRDI